jgi:Tfp pilus assembly protein PilV
MHSFFATLLADHRHRRRRRRATGQSPRFRGLGGGRPRARVQAQSEDGVLLVEVIVSALLVALVVVGTLNGFDAAKRTSVDERNHNEATLLAAESQEQLRSDPASTFDSPKNSFEHTYTKKINGETYTITQSASFLNSAGESTTCNATNTNRQETNALRLTSSVTWPQLLAAGRPAVKASSTTTPPTGSTLEVDVGNYAPPTAGVSGVTTPIKYTPESSSTTSTLQGTTEASGCVVFASLPTTSAIVSVNEKQGFVTPSGAWDPEPKEVEIAPNYTTHYAVTFNEGGAIQAEFTFQNATKWKHKLNNSSTEIEEPVTMDTFVAYNELMEATPDFELGSAKGTYTATSYEPAFGSTEAGTYAHAIATPIEATKYPHGNLFPFTEPNSWRVYAGACTANNPNKLNGAIIDPTGYVTSGNTTTITKVPTAYMQLNVYTGSSSSSKGSFQETTAYPVTITNTGCKSITPDNEPEFNEPKEQQKQTINASPWTEYGGHLEHPFLPLGPGKLCLAYNISSPSAKHYTYTSSYELKAGEEYVRNIYLGDTPSTTPSTYSETVKRSPSNASETAEVTVTKSNSTVKCS